ncbi:hypothetical protein BH11MYX2_BH11MYX2_29890 [soil metagenome]
MGIEVRCAANGAEGLVVLDQGKADPPALVLSDVVMPGVLGVSIVEYLQHEPSFGNTQVALITGSPELVGPGVRVFPKPADIAGLKAFISSVVPLPA